MPETGFHFGQPIWLLCLLLLLPVAMWLRRSTVHGRDARLARYADERLLPHLTGSRELHTGERQRRFFRWAALWCLLVLALAGPRWDYREIQLFTPGADLVILLDISRSMAASDVRPDRLTRARQEIEDLINQNPGVRVGLVAFASVAHVVAPITEDGESIRSQLPALSTDLVRLQGSRLSQALERARGLLAGQPEASAHNLLLISDGDFAEPGLEEQVRGLAASGVRLHVLGVGDTAGAPIPVGDGRWLTDAQRNVIQSRLDEPGLQRLAEAGAGIYRRADYLGEDTAAILRAAAEGGEAQAQADRKTLVWNERFHWLVLPLMLVLLGRFRRYRRLEEGL